MRTTYGNGTIASVMKANTAVAQSYPSFLYTGRDHQHLQFVISTHIFLLWIPKSGKIAPKVLLAKLFAARALAAYRGYASTRKVHVPENDKKTLSRISNLPQKVKRTPLYPIPKIPLPIRGTIQCTDLYVVKPNQKSPAGTSTAPAMT